MIPYAAAGPTRPAVARLPTVGPRTRRERGEQLSDHVAVVEGVHDAVDLLAGLVALAGDHHDVAGPGQPERRGDRLAAVAHLDHLGAVPARAPVQHRGPDRGRVLGARVVVGDDQDVGEPGGDLAHDRPLARVPVTPGAEHDDQPAVGQRPQGLERGLRRRPACGRSRRSR